MPHGATRPRTILNKVVGLRTPRADAVYVVGAAQTAYSGAARGLVILFADAAMLGKDFKVEKLMTCVCSVK